MATDTVEAEDDVTVVVPPSGETGNTTETEPKQPEKTAETEKAKEPAADLAEQFKAAQAGHEREKARRVEVERQIAQERQRVARVEQERDAARQGMATREMDAINAGISAADTEASAAEAEYQTAFEAGDAKRMAEAQRRMARAEARKLRFDEAKQDLEARQETTEPETRERTRQPAQQPADQFETYLSQFSPKTAGWLREHREWVSDGKKNAKLQAAHFDAVANDIQPDTDEYFAHVEEKIGLREASEPEPAPKPNGAAKPAARKGPPAAPPVSGGGRGGGGNGGNEVRLSKTEATAATDGTHVWGAHDLAAGRIKDKTLVGMPIGVTEFARRKLSMQQQGLYDRSYLEQ